MKMTKRSIRQGKKSRIEKKYGKGLNKYLVMK